jgi:hypothetical protein
MAVFILDIERSLVLPRYFSVVFHALQEPLFYMLVSLYGPFAYPYVAFTFLLLRVYTRYTILIVVLKKSFWGKNLCVDILLFAAATAVDLLAYYFRYRRSEIQPSEEPQNLDRSPLMWDVIESHRKHDNVELCCICKDRPAVLKTLPCEHEIYCIDCAKQSTGNKTYSYLCSPSQQGSQRPIFAYGLRSQYPRVL